MATKSRRFGSLRRLPSGRWQARYVGPDRQTHTAPVTYTTKGDAETFLATVRADIARATWRPPTERKPTVPNLASFSEEWLTGRELKPRTRALYRGLLDQLLVPAFGAVALDQITPAQVRTWHQQLAEETGPTRRAHAYSLLRTILNTAVADDLIVANPCRIRGAGASKRVKQIVPADLDELRTIEEAMPERLRLMVLLAAWCLLRYGELAELRRRDVDTKKQVLRVRRGVTWVDGEPIVGTPKSAAGVGDVAIPPHLLPAIRDHLLRHTGKGRDGLLFTAVDGESYLTHDALKNHFERAREAAGRPDLRFHDLRHTGGTFAALAGATTVELMAMLRDSTPGMAIRYQHVARGRAAEIAERLSRIANGGDSR